MRFCDFLIEVLRGSYLVRLPTGKINSQLGNPTLDLHRMHWRFIRKTILFQSNIEKTSPMQDLWRAMRQTAKVDAKVERVGTVCMATHSPGSQGGSGQAGDTTWVSVAGQPTHTDNNNFIN